MGARPGNNNGGPATEDGAALALANLTPNSEGLAALKHGVYAADGVFMRCDRCCLRETCEAAAAGGDCLLEREYVRDRRAQLLTLPFVDAGLDGPALSILLWLEVRLTRAARFLSHEGELLPGADAGYLEYCPLAADVSKLVSSWRETAKALSIFPEGRKKMADTGEAGPAADLAKAFRDLARQEKEREAQTADGEFEAEPDGDDGGEA